MLLNSLERNDELGIDARLTSGGGLARYFAQDQDSEFMLLAGAVANQEWTNDEAEPECDGVSKASKACSARAGASSVSTIRRSA